MILNMIHLLVVEQDHGSVKQLKWRNIKLTFWTSISLLVSLYAEILSNSFHIWLTKSEQMVFFNVLNANLKLQTEKTVMEMCISKKFSNSTRKFFPSYRVFFPYVFQYFGKLKCTWHLMALRFSVGTGSGMVQRTPRVILLHYITKKGFFCYWMYHMPSSQLCHNCVFYKKRFSMLIKTVVC